MGWSGEVEKQYKEAVIGQVPSGPFELINKRAEIVDNAVIPVHFPIAAVHLCIPLRVPIILSKVVRII